MRWSSGDLRSVLALGAHPDDVEIGAGATLALIAHQHPATQFTFVCLTGGVRSGEAVESASSLLGERVTVHIGDFSDTVLPYQDAATAKTWTKAVTEATAPDVVFAPNLEDRHQDHRFVAELAWQLFRRADILEYEIPKWEGDRPSANLFSALTPEMVEGKLDHLDHHFPSQHGKPWYTRDLFSAVLRLRGVESGTPHAEGFVARKLTWKI